MKCKYIHIYQKYHTASRINIGEAATNKIRYKYMLVTYYA